MSVIPRDPPPAAGAGAEVWFEVYGKRYEMPTKLTFGEAATFKRLTGQTIDETAGGMNTTAVAAMVLIALRRADPSVTEADIDQLVIEDTLQTRTPTVEEAAAQPPLVLTAPPEAVSETSAGGSETGPEG